MAPSSDSCAGASTTPNLSEHEVEERALELVSHLDGLLIGSALDVLHAARDIIYSTHLVDAEGEGFRSARAALRERRAALDEAP